MKIASRKNSKIPNRNGYTLIEQVAVISLMGTVMSIVVGILIYCMKTERSFSAQARRMQVVHMLSEELRNDIHLHNWNQIRIDADQSLHLSENKSKPEITYHWKDHMLLRERHNKDSQPGSESFWFPEGSQIHWSKNETSKTVSLQIEQPTRGSNPSTTDQKTFRKLTIKAQAGRFSTVTVAATGGGSE